MSKTVGIKEIDATISALNKLFKTDLLDFTYPVYEPISTQSAALDAALRIGGVPRGAIIEIFGPESSGKTSISLAIMKSAQEIRKAKGITNKRDLILDVEHSMTKPFVEGFGIDLEQVIWLRPKTAEQALQTLIDLTKTGMIDVALLDSVDAMQNERQLSRKQGEADMGGISKNMSESLRQLSKLAPDNETTMVFINQVRANPQAGYGNPQVTPGGKALAFYAAVRLETMLLKPSTDIPGAALMRVKIKKTKIGAPWAGGEVPIDFIYGKGPDPYMDLITFAKAMGVLRFAGPSVKEGDKVLVGGGKAGLVAYLQENPEEMARIKKVCFERSVSLADGKESPDTEVEAEA